MNITLINLEVGKYLAQPLYTISYTVGEGTDSYRAATCPPGIPDRGQIINAVIRQDYPEDRMEAVINNYLLDPTDEDAKVAFDEMQEFRKSVKEFADSIINEINKD